MGDFISGYYALDVTHPDKLDGEQQPDPADRPELPRRPPTAPSPAAARCRSRPSSGSSPTRSPPRSWTRTRTASPTSGRPGRCRSIGRIKVIEGGNAGRQVRRHLRRRHGRRQQAEPEARQLALHGGHRDRQDDLQAQARRRRAADPAVLDTDLDGYLDTIYIGTTAGFLYKMDISSAGDAAGRHAAHHPGGAAPRRRRDGEADHRHVVGPLRDLRHAGRPIYLAPTIFYVSRLGRFALAFGTGDRENLWNLDGQVGRFYLIVDDNFTSGGAAEDGGELSGDRRHRGQRQLLDQLPAEPRPGKSKGLVPEAAGGRAGDHPDLRPLRDRHLLRLPAAGDRDRSGRASAPAAAAATSTWSTPTTATRSCRWAARRPASASSPKFVTNPYVEQGATKNPPTGGSGGSGGSGGTGGTAAAPQLRSARPHAAADHRSSSRSSCPTVQVRQPLDQHQRQRLRHGPASATRASRSVSSSRT